MKIECKSDILTPVNSSRLQQQDTRIKPHGNALVGKKVKTTYGTGVVSAFRHQDSMYEIQLTTEISNEISVTKLYTQEVPDEIHTKQDAVAALNVAYEALENMRRLNLEMQCFDAGITDVDHGHCTACLLSNSIPTKRFPRLQKAYEDVNAAQESAAKNIARIPNLFKWKEQPKPNAVCKPAAATATNSTIGIASSVGKRNAFQEFAMTSTAKIGKATENGLSKMPRLWGNKTSETKENQSTSGNRTTPQDDRKPATKLWGNKTGETKEKEPASTSGNRTIPEDDRKPAAKEKRVLGGVQNLLDARLKQRSPACLICASPSCPTHSSPGFRKDGIVVCLSCERLFQLDFIVSCVKEPDPQIRAKHIDHMIDLYDRCLLLLKYSAQFIEEIARSMEASQENQNKIGLGSSGVGVVSGVLGIAAAATILTPAGAPLLITSLVFGGGATTVQVGTEAMNYLSESNKLADRIIALHGMTLSILRVTSTLRDAMLRLDYIRTDGIFECEKGDLAEVVQMKYEKHRNGVVAGTNAGVGVALGVGMSEAGALAAADASALAAQAAARAATTEAGIIAGAQASARGASVASRATTASSAAARGLRFARFAGGALSAAVLLMEANAMHHTIRNIQEGNPCEKANVLRQILKEIEDSALPSSSDLDEECQRYLEAMKSRPNIPEVNAVVAEGHTVDIPEAECTITPSDGGMMASGAIIVNANETSDLSLPVVAEEARSSLTSSVMNGGSSLLQRIQMHQQRQRENRAARNDEVFAVATESEEGARRVQLNLIS